MTVFVNPIADRCIRRKLSLMSVVFLLVLFPVRSAQAWEMGRDYNFACFQGDSRTPIKVVVKSLSYVEITWAEYPVRYDFVHAGAHLMAGRLYVDASLSQSKSVNKEIEKILSLDFNFNQMTWITKEVVIVDIENRKVTTLIAAGEQSKFLGVMNCVDL